MSEPTSHFDPMHAPADALERAPGALAALPAALALLAAALAVVEVVAGSELARVVEIHLDALADPAAWIR